MEVEGPRWVKDGVSASASVPGKLYAVGGYDGASRQCLSTVEQYNPATNEWTYVADMSTRRSGAGTGPGRVGRLGARALSGPLSGGTGPQQVHSLPYLPFPSQSVLYTVSFVVCFFETTHKGHMIFSLSDLLH